LKIKRQAYLITLFIFASIGIAAAAIPGPQRMIAPSWFGLSEVAPNVFSDDPSKAKQQLAFIDQSNQTVSAFFGDLQSTPRIIFCTTMKCEQTFGKNGSVAVAYGWHFIHIPPRAFIDPIVGQVLVTHEHVHIELVKRWGWTALYDEKIPSWFNEGLASLLSQDSRIRYNHNQAERGWIKQSTSFWEWGNFATKEKWRSAYGSAASEVKLLQDKLGNDGLLTLINNAIERDGLESALKETLQR
jgi:hypothetical protein